MQSLAKLLVIDDDDSSRSNLSNILEFVGESCKAVSSEQLGDIDWSDLWSGCIVGNILSDSAAESVRGHLNNAYHIPLLMMGRFPLPVDELPSFVGELEQPLNYPQLSNALRHCKDFLGRKGVNVVASSRKNTLFRSLVGQSRGIQEVRHLIEQVAKTDANVLILGE